MPDLPAWVQVSQALVVPSIAAAVAVIGFLQWRTAHQKVLLDLFERRMKVYEAVNDAISDALTVEGKMVLFNAGVSLRRAQTEAGFLFGKEVSAEIQRLIELANLYGIRKREFEGRNLPENKRDEVGAELADLMDSLSAWRDPWTAVCRPYLTMDQKRVRTPSEWFADRNALRKSFDDQK